MIQAVTFDFETELIAPFNQIPDPVCMAFAEIRNNSVAGSWVVTAADAAPYLNRFLDDGVLIVGANTAFDVLVSLRLPGIDPEQLLRKWAYAYNHDRVTDVFLRQKLFDIATNRYRFDHIREGVTLVNNYNLGDIAKRHKVQDVDKTNPWRYRYAELKGLPISAYPWEAYEYPRIDARATGDVFLGQKYQAANDTRLREFFPGCDVYLPQFDEARGAVPLKAASAWGLITDPEAVAELREEIEREIGRVREDLTIECVETLPCGILVKHPALVRREVSRNTEGILKFLHDNDLIHLFFEKDQKLHLRKKHFLATEHPALILLASGLHTREQEEWLAEQGLLEITYHRNTRVAMDRCLAAYVIRGKAIPRTDSWDPKLDQDPSEYVSLNSDACTQSLDTTLFLYAEYSTLAKTLSTDIPKLLERGRWEPIHTNYEALLVTGRTASSAPNVQNVRRLPGIRECFIPRQGCLFVSADFGKIELHTLAQICLRVVGYSKLSEALNAGRDPHLMIASAILNCAYEWAVEHKDDQNVDGARTAGKGVNFGRPGRLSAKTFVVYCWTNYKIRITLDKAIELLRIYDEAWPEVSRYFKWVDSYRKHRHVNGKPSYVMTDSGQWRPVWDYNLVSVGSGFLRAGAGVTDACNHGFQHLASRVLKRALWYVWQATMGVFGREDPLYGSRICNEIHDEIVLETPIGKEQGAALRLVELMDLAGKELLPDCPVKASPAISTCWSKKAKSKMKNGVLTIWDPVEACLVDIRAFDPGKLEPEKGIVDMQTWLRKKQEWPRRIIRKALAA
jgi:hypothetical protein